MIKICRILAAVVCLASFACVITGCSLQNPKSSIHTLIITGNYQEPRIMAELIQAENGQPYIVVPNSFDNRIFFVPNRRSEKNQPIQISPTQFRQFISMIGPKRVVILGDERFVPASYEKAIPNTITKSRVSNSVAWTEVARYCQDYMNLTNLVNDYNRTIYELRLRHDPNTTESFVAGDGTPTTLTISEPRVESQPRPVVRTTETIIELPAPEPIIEEAPQPVEETVIPK